MKDAKGHGSDPRGAAHQQGVDALGRVIGYHGTASQFDTFEPHAPYIKLTNQTQALGIYFTTDPNAAYSYASRAAREGRGGDRRVIQGELTMHNPLDITDLIKSGQKSGLSFGEAKAKALTHFAPEHDGVIFRGDRANPPEYMVRVGKQVRVLNVTAFKSRPRKVKP